MQTKARQCWILLVMMFALAWANAAAFADDAVSDEPNAATSSTDGQPDAGIRVTLKEPGEEPRRTLRLRVSPGDTQRFVIRHTASMKQTMDGNPPTEQQSPPVEMHLKLDVARVTDDGDIHFTGEYEEISVKEHPDVADRMHMLMQHSLQDMVGMDVELVLSDRGIVRSVDMNIDRVEDVRAKELVQYYLSTFSQLITPLPEEPVGKGAKWTYDVPSDLQGLKVVTSFDVTLTELLDAGFAGTMNITPSAEEQDFDTRGAVRSADVTLKSVRGEGSGRFTHPLDRAMPHSDVESVASLHFVMTTPDQDFNRGQHVTTTLKVSEPTEAEADEEQTPDQERPDQETPQDDG